MVFGLDDIGIILLTSAVTSAASNALKGPIDQFLGTLIPTADAPLRNLLTAAGSGVITLEQFQAATAFKKLDPEDKQVVLAIVAGKRRADAEDALVKATEAAAKQARRAVDDYDSDVHKPLMREIDEIDAAIDKTAKLQDDLDQDEIDFAVKDEVQTLQSAIDFNESKANRLGLI